jgi:hypothetical protein
MIASFALTSALSAFLLFLIQPLVAKPLLPLLGGSPSVWNTCMLVFQLLLLLGYSYAYAGSRFLAPRRQSLVHVSLLAATLLLLPFGLMEAGFDPVEHPQSWLIVTLLQSIGIPYTLLAASAPMLQRWIASSNDPMAANPYPLYAASNIGSFLALLAYPFGIEPRLPTQSQFNVFSGGYVFLVLGFIVCALLLGRRLLPVAATLQTAPERADFRQISGWIFFAFIPASLLYGVTTYLISDIASVPLLWLIPLMLYLLSFIITFSDRPLSLRALARIIPVGAVLTMLLSLFVELRNAIGIPQILVPAVILAIIFACFIYFHRVLYLRRPPTHSLAFYYVVVSLGGVLGGIFNALLAPVLFESTLEFTIVLLAAGLVSIILRPDGTFSEQVYHRPRRWLMGCVALPLFFNLMLRVSLPEQWDETTQLTVLGLCVGLLIFLFLVLTEDLFSSIKRSMLGLTFFSLLLIAMLAEGHFSLFTHRNFFGISRVSFQEKNNAHIYTHGVTVHGMQSLDPEKRLNPVSYYVPLRQVFEQVEAAQVAPAAVLGLGVGTIACYAQPKQAMDFYEIDPAPILVANNPDLFTYMRDCPGERTIIVGDGRLEMRRAQDGQYGIIVMDAFTSDAIPVHLLTLEALTLYGSKLRPDGVIAFNISNRFLDLVPVLTTLAHELGWTGAVRSYVTHKPLEASSIWVALFPEKEVAQAFMTAAPEWRLLPPVSEPRYKWTDQYSSLLSVIFFNPAQAEDEQAEQEEKAKEMKD